VQLSISVSSIRGRALTHGTRVLMAELPHAFARFLLGPRLASRRELAAMRQADTLDLTYKDWIAEILGVNFPREPPESWGTSAP